MRAVSACVLACFPRVMGVARRWGSGEKKEGMEDYGEGGGERREGREWRSEGEG